MATSLVIEELSGSSPIHVVMRGGLNVLRGAEFGSQLHGAKHLPLGSREAVLSATAFSYDDTTMELALDAVFIKPSELQVVGADAKPTPEGIVELLVLLQQRARECNVQIAGFKRIGVLREVKPKPGRGYTVDPTTGKPGDGGLNMEVSLKWEWSGDGSPTPLGPSKVTGLSLAGSLSAASSKLASAIADVSSFETNFLGNIQNQIARVRASIGNLRALVKGVGDIVLAPARTISAIAAAARDLGNVVHDLDNLIADTADEYKAAGNSLAALVRTKAALGKVADGMNDAADSVVAILAALASAGRSTVGVRPGQNLTTVARAELGNAARWTEIATLNDLPGQVVPAGVYTVDLPPR